MGTEIEVELPCEGTMECPYCGVATPHRHKPDAIKGMVPGLVPRLSKLAEELPKVGFYHRGRANDIVAYRVCPAPPRKDIARETE